VEFEEYFEEACKKAGGKLIKATNAFVCSLHPFYRVTLEYYPDKERLDISAELKMAGLLLKIDKPKKIMALDEGVLRVDELSIGFSRNLLTISGKGTVEIYFSGTPKS